MTSAVAFARDHSSIWGLLTPTADIFVRRLNGHLYEREYVPLKSDVLPNRRAMVNEIAFRLFSNAIIEGWIYKSPSNQGIDSAIKDVQVTNSQYHAGPEGLTQPNEIEIREFLILYERLRQFFTRRSSAAGSIETYPRFSGCGILETCAGDIYFPTTLFEVKAGDRSFRTIDIRQLLVYSALNAMENKREITHVGLFNPRTGVFFVAELNELCRDVSGRPAVDLFSEIIRVVSSGDISR